MAKLTLAQAAAWCGGRVEKKYENVIFDGASNDTRTIGQGQLFVALVGVRDGNDFIGAAFEKGATAVLTSRPTGDYPAIVVDDPRIALGQIAAGLRQKMGMTVVGVTGSVGKSTTKEMIACVLASDYIVSKTPANFNNDLGLPITILGMDPQTRVGVLEMGMSHAGEISYLSHIAKPDIGVITNVGVMHIENFGSQQGILQAKMEILDGMDKQGTLCLFADDTNLWNSREKITQPVVYFGCDNQDGQILAEDIQQQENAVHFTVRTKKERFAVMLPVEGLHYVADALAAIAVGLLMGIPSRRIADKLSTFRNMAGRQECFEEKGFHIIKDCYNAGPASMEAALKVLSNRKGRRVAVLGDMLELGDHREQAHRQVGKIAAQCADLLLVLGDCGHDVICGAWGAGMQQEQTIRCNDRDQMVQQLKTLCRPGDVLLFKGSHGMHMELVLEKFLSE